MSAGMGIYGSPVLPPKPVGSASCRASRPVISVCLGSADSLPQRAAEHRLRRVLYAHVRPGHAATHQGGAETGRHGRGDHGGLEATVSSSPVTLRCWSVAFRAEAVSSSTFWASSVGRTSLQCSFGSQRFSFSMSRQTSSTSCSATASCSRFSSLGAHRG